MPTVTLTATIRLPSTNQLMPAGTTLDVDDETAARYKKLGLIEPVIDDTTSEHDGQELDADEPTATAPKLERPPRSSTTDRWRKYAQALYGLDTKGLTKQEIIAVCNQKERESE